MFVVSRNTWINIMNVGSVKDNCKIRLSFFALSTLLPLIIFLYNKKFLVDAISYDVRLNRLYLRTCVNLSIFICVLLLYAQVVTIHNK